VKEKGFSKKFFIIGAALVLFVIALIYFYSSNTEAFHDIVKTYGLLGLFFGAIIANASILLPIPIDIFVFLLGGENFLGLGILSALVMGVVVGLGSAIGEMSGYMIGFMGSEGIEHFTHEELKKIKEIKSRIKNFGSLFIALGAFTPFPFDVIGIGAGLLRYDIKKFFIACFIGKAARYAVIAYAGAFSLSFVRGFFGF